MMLRTRIQSDPFAFKGDMRPQFAVEIFDAIQATCSSGGGTYALYLPINAVKARAQGGGDTSWF